jgi:hypothetical protein
VEQHQHQPPLLQQLPALQPVVYLLQQQQQWQL